MENAQIMWFSAFHWFSCRANLARLGLFKLNCWKFIIIIFFVYYRFCSTNNKNNNNKKNILLQGDKNLLKPLNVLHRY